MDILTKQLKLQELSDLGNFRDSEIINYCKIMILKSSGEYGSLCGTE